MYAAQLLAARRRGSSMTIFLPASQGSSSRAGGMHVVLPLPGGAVSTTVRLRASERRMSSIFSSAGNLIPPIFSHPAKIFKDEIFIYISPSFVL